MPPRKKHVRQWWVGEKYTAKKYLPFTTAIGQSTLSWNDLHEALGQLFWTVLGGGFSDLPLGIWQVIRNDRTQRSVLLEASKASLSGKGTWCEEGLENIKWIIARASELEDDRNNAVHAPLQSSESTKLVFPSSSFGNTRAKNLENKDILKEFRRLRDTAILLRDFSHRLSHVLADSRRTWPKRPRLPDRQGSKIPEWHLRGFPEVPPHLRQS